MIKLYYFDAYAIAEQIRMALTHAKVEFEDIRIKREELPKLKEELNLEFGQLPVVEMDGKFYGQSIATLRFIGKKHGYYPDEATWRIDSLIDSLGDIWSVMGKIIFETDEEKKKVSQ